MASESLSFGVDLGGTKVDIGLVNAKGHVIDRILIKTRSQEGEQAVIQDIIDSIQVLYKKNSCQGVLPVGIGMAGQIQKETGVVRFAPNLHWHHVPLSEMLHRALQFPVYVINDVRAAAWGEWLYGAGQGCHDLLCLFVGTGIGGGVVSGGRMLYGHNNSAGEVGHMTLDIHGPQCTCGNYGCFEALASGWAIARRAREAVQRDPIAGRPLLALVQNRVEDLTSRHVFELSRMGDPIAQSIVNEVSIDLVAGVAGLINAFNPQRVILGGGIMQGYPEFIQAIRDGIPTRALQVAVEAVDVVPAQLHNSAGVVGAAAFATTSEQGD